MLWNDNSEAVATISPRTEATFATTLAGRVVKAAATLDEDMPNLNVAPLCLAPQESLNDSPFYVIFVPTDLRHTVALSCWPPNESRSVGHSANCCPAPRYTTPGQSIGEPVHHAVHSARSTTHQRMSCRPVEQRRSSHSREVRH